MITIKRVTNRQKKIINRILKHGLERYYYDDFDDTRKLANEFDVSVEVVEACIEYIESKFLFWGVV